MEQELWSVKQRQLTFSRFRRRRRRRDASLWLKMCLVHICRLIEGRVCEAISRINTT